ncbi:hypothetical protein BC832DRAFT_544120 [Gaertneriomyces semiglobifer]|nr:hypothetical protein BC832DRAFT_544120 [Gaertneriomyces semiglobifer]
MPATHLSRSASTPNVGFTSDPKQGFLFKRSRQRPNRWLRRHFRWDGQFFTYHHSSSQSSEARLQIPAGSIIRVVPSGHVPGAGYVFHIWVNAPEPPLEVAASSRPVMEDWVTILNANINSRLYRRQSAKNGEKPPNGDQLPRSKSMGGINSSKRQGMIATSMKTFADLPPLPKTPLPVPLPFDLRSRPAYALDNGVTLPPSPPSPASPSAGATSGTTLTRKATTDSTIKDTSKQVRNSQLSIATDFTDETVIPSKRGPLTASASDLEQIIERMFKEAHEEYASLSRPGNAANLSKKAPKSAHPIGAAQRFQFPQPYPETLYATHRFPRQMPNKFGDMHQSLDSIVSTSLINDKARVPALPTLLKVSDTGALTGPTNQPAAPQSTSKSQPTSPVMRKIAPVNRFKSAEKLETLMNTMLATGDLESLAFPAASVKSTPVEVDSTLKPTPAEWPKVPTPADPRDVISTSARRPLPAFQPAHFIRLQEEAVRHVGAQTSPTLGNLNMNNVGSSPRRNSADSIRTITRLSMHDSDFIPPPTSPQKQGPLLSSLIPLILSPTVRRELVLRKVVHILKHGTSLHRRLNREEEWQDTSLDVRVDLGVGSTMPQLAARIKARRKALDEYRVAVEDLGRRTRDYIKSLPGGEKAILGAAKAENAGVSKVSDGAPSGTQPSDRRTSRLSTDFYHSLRRPSAISILSSTYSSASAISTTVIDLIESIEIMLMKVAQLREIFGQMV